MREETQKRTNWDARTIAAWALWDCGAAAFSAVLITFIFSVYLTDSVGAQIASPLTPAQWLSVSMTVAGLAIFALAPVMGQRSDARGTRRRALGVWSAVTFVLMTMLFFVRNDAPEYFWLGLTLLALGSITIQFAEVNYFAQLTQISHPSNVGTISGVGWAAGYVGGIVLLLICYVGFISGDGGMLGLSTDAGWNIRVVALVAAAWFGLCSMPVLRAVPEIAPTGARTGGIRAAYAKLFADVVDLWRTDRNACYFLLASAIFRDGLSAVFAFGAVLGVSVYGLSASDVLLFGVAANVVAALGAGVGGLLDDKVGPKPIIMSCLVILTGMAGVMFVASGPRAFWFCGLLLCVCVGPAQSAARSFLARVAPEGKEGQMFGLYTTTGRAVSWLAPGLFALFVSLLGQGDRGGILAIGAVLALGALLLIPVRDHVRSPAPPEAESRGPESGQ